MAETSVLMRPAGPVLEIAFWPAAHTKGSAALAESLGLKSPPAPGVAEAGDDARLWRKDPVTWRLMGPAAGEPRETPANAMQEQIGPGLSLLEVRGPEAAGVMARAVPLDLRPGAFPPGSVAITGHRHVAVTVFAMAEGYDVLVPRSYGEDFLPLFRTWAARLS